MTRDVVRSLKRAMRAGTKLNADARDKTLASESALLLLSRSISFGHGRLAVVRLAMAVDAGAPVPGEHWAYCAQVARTSKDRQLQEIYLAAAQTANTSLPTFTA
jgi:hypothetical protein